MKLRTQVIFVALLASQSGEAERSKPIHLYPGYTTRINCQGRLLLSAIGNDQLVQLDALPSELGCGILLRPKTGKGRTDLAAETSAGSILRIVNIEPENSQPEASALIYVISGDSK